MFDFWGTGEQANLFQGNEGTGTPTGRASLISELVSSDKSVFLCFIVTQE